jgi:hypothetical protein
MADPGPVLDPGILVDLDDPSVELVRTVLPWTGDPVPVAVLLVDATSS